MKRMKSTIVEGPFTTNFFFLLSYIQLMILSMFLTWSKYTVFLCPPLLLTMQTSDTFRFKFIRIRTLCWFILQYTRSWINTSISNEQRSSIVNWSQLICCDFIACRHISSGHCKLHTWQLPQTTILLLSPRPPLQKHTLMKISICTICNVLKSNCAEWCPPHPHPRIVSPPLLLSPPPPPLPHPAVQRTELGRPIPHKSWELFSFFPFTILDCRLATFSIDAFSLGAFFGWRTR